MQRTKNIGFGTTRLMFVLVQISLVLAGISISHAGSLAVGFSSHELVARPGETEEIQLSYDVLEGAVQTTGLGLRIHYNSEAVESLDLQDLYAVELIGKDFSPHEDVDDLDHDPKTDKYLCAAWLSIQGQWPAAGKLPLALGKISLDLRLDAPSRQTRINITASSVPVGYAFTGGTISVGAP